MNTFWLWNCVAVIAITVFVTIGTAKWRQHMDRRPEVVVCNICSCLIFQWQVYDEEPLPTAGMFQHMTLAHPETRLDGVQRYRSYTLKAQ